MFSMNLKKVQVFMLIALFIPVMVSGILSPAVNKAFIEAVNVEIIASSKFVSEGLAMLVAFIGCWKRGVGIFLRLYYPMWALVIGIDFIVAYLAMDHMEIRFFLNAIQSAIGIAIISQSLGYYATRVIPQEEMVLFSNKERTILGGAAMLGAFIATILGSINVQLALWINFVFGFISFAVNTVVLINFKNLFSKMPKDE